MNGVKIISYDHKHHSYKTWLSTIIYQDRSKIVTKNSVPFVITYLDNKRKEFPIKTYITFFFKKWFNIINVYDFKGHFIHWYVNVATPIVLDNKNIVYDDLLLDLKIYPNYKFDLLDKDEFDKFKHEIDNKKKRLIPLTINKLIQMISVKSPLFDKNLPDK